MVGKTLGHYEITARLGAGGMGEVYRARDSKLDRDVAIKVLPEDFAADPERLARFEREAKLLASLNHSNIAAIYGLEDEGDQRFIVMEVVEGETLAQSIAKSGRLDAKEAIEIAHQIAEALEAAHESGVIHRDLKPANVIVTPDGKVKVLDFGLAKGYEVDGPAAGNSPDLSHSPTMVGATHTGVILGTAAYMSPEQARGKLVDKRADIWAFGCVLYEMMAGSRAFDGETVSDTLAAILKEEPDGTALPDDTHPLVRRLIARCLEKDPRRRLRDVGDGRVELDEVLAGETATMIHRPVPSPTQPPWLRLPWFVAVCVALVAATVLAMSFLLGPGDETEFPRTQRWSVKLPAGRVLDLGNLNITNPVALSMDGRNLVLSVRDAGVRQLYRRTENQWGANPIPGTEDSHKAFFSPDGRWMGFETGTSLWKVSIGGGGRELIGEIPGADTLGVSWGEDDTILFGSYEGIWRISGTGGTAELVIAPPEESDALMYVDPFFLPGGETALFSIWRGTTESSSIAVVDLRTREYTIVLDGGTSAQYTPTGHIVFLKSGSLHAATFDLDRLAVGESSEVITDLSVGNLGRARFSLSSSGTLAFVPGSETSGSRFVWVNRDGVAAQIAQAPRVFLYPRLSPDGDSLAVTVVEGADRDVWVYDLARGGAPLPLPGVDSSRAALWSHDGAWLIFASGGDRTRGIYRTRADLGDPAAELVIETDGAQLPESWDPTSGRVVITDGGDLSVLELTDPPTMNPLLESPDVERNASVSPDGRWIAYQSDVSGASEVYVRSFPGGGPPRKISLDGGQEPLWSRSGTELFFRSGTTMFAVAVDTEGGLTYGAPRELFSGPYFNNATGRNWDVAEDGRFLMMEVAGQAAGRDEVHVVLNWFEELKAMVPASTLR